jgi:two-component system NtrC family response regulator
LAISNSNPTTPICTPAHLTRVGRGSLLDSTLRDLGIFVASPVLVEAARRAETAASSSLPVLLFGETGTGKDRFAQLIHELSTRSSRSWIAVNCAGIPRELAESYLFGHVKGSFTGAIGDKKGIFEEADGTTLFLDEIAELTLEVQAKLLRVLQNGTVQRLGSTVTRHVDVRVIAATNKDLRREADQGRFREDLFYRLEVVQIKLPPLRERKEEIAELAVALVSTINQKRLVSRQLSSAALRRLEQHDWPGNVRELLNVLERSVLYSQGDTLLPEDLLITENRAVSDLFARLPEPCHGFSLERCLQQLRKRFILRALAKSNGNQTEAARLLGLTKQAVSKFLSDNPH